MVTRAARILDLYLIFSLVQVRLLWLVHLHRPLPGEGREGKMFQKLRFIGSVMSFRRSIHITRLPVFFQVETA